jgi:hypothetical protein
MARFTSVNGFVGLGFETTTGTPVTPTQFLPIISAEIGDTVDHLRAATTIRVGGHTITRPQTGKKTVTPKMSGPLLYNLIGALYRGIDGTVATSGSGPYTHVFSPGTSQGFTFELAVSGAIADSRKANGTVMTELVLNFPRHEICTFDASYAAFNVAAPATKTAISYPTLNEIVGAHCTTMSLGSTVLKNHAGDVKVTITNAVKPGYGCTLVGGEMVVSEWVDGASREMKIEFPLEMDTASWNDFQVRHITAPLPTEDDFTYTLTNPSTSETLTIVARNCVVSSSAEVKVGDPDGDVVRVTIMLTPRADPPGGDAAYTITMVNSDASPYQT